MAAERLQGTDRLEPLARTFRERVVSERPDLADLEVTIERYVFSEPDDWCWSFSFDLRDDYAHALWNGEDEFLVFEDEAGHFEDHVAFEDVPRRVAESLASA